MQKVLSLLLALTLPAAGSLYAQSAIGTIELQGSRVNLKSQIIPFSNRL